MLRISSIKRQLPTIEKICTALGIIGFIVLLFLLSNSYINSNDFWWQLAIGRWIVQNGIVLHHDVFSYTFNGVLFFNPHWLFDVTMYHIYSWFSYYGLNTFRFVLLLSAYFFLLKSAAVKRKIPLLLSISIFALTLITIRSYLRPELSLPLFFGFFLYALYEGKYNQSKLVYLLPFAQAIWVNTNGGYIFGPVVVGIFFGSELLRTLILYRKNILVIFKKNILLRRYFFVLIGTAAALFVSSYGTGIIRWLSNHFVFDEGTAEATAFIAEWSPLPIKALFTISFANLSTYILFFWLALTLFIIRSLHIWKKMKKISVFLQSFFYEDVLIFLLFTYLTIQHVRFQYIFTLAVAVLILRNIHYLKTFFYNSVIKIILIISASTIIIFQMQPQFNLYAGPKPDRYPDETVSFIQKYEIKGPMYNEYNDGGYLIWKLYPDVKVFIDGRTPNVYTNDFYWYTRNVSNENIFSSLDEKFNFNFVLIDKASVLNKKFFESDDWVLVSYDNTDALFLKKNEQNESIIASHNLKILNPLYDEAKYLDTCEKQTERNLLDSEIDRITAEQKRPLHALFIQAFLLAECPDPTSEQLNNAISRIDTLIDLNPNNYKYYHLKGKIYIDLDRNEDAVISFKKSLTLSKTAESLTGLGIAYHNLGEYRAAKKIFQQVPFSQGTIPDKYYQIYARVRYQLDENQQAIELFHRYLSLTPKEKITSQDYIDIAEAYKDLGDDESYRLYLEKISSL